LQKGGRKTNGMIRENLKGNARNSLREENSTKALRTGPNKAAGFPLVVT